ncbi:MAG: dehydrogenase E1 component subunit alpha/beta [Cyclobacteriaceae bacterium]
MNKIIISHKQIRSALLIRKVEEKFLELFSHGKLNGTVHTCVGQEFSAIAFAGQLKKSDFIFSNHRCHGHYISFTNDLRGLLAELMGKKTGTSGGVGSSQHLCNGNFFSNGIQGGIVPVAAGYALANKLKENGAIGVVYIGDGTLGEGTLYETMNIISKWQIPLLIVCENNFYAQSTPQNVNLAGDILKRSEAFDIKTFKGDTWNPDILIDEAKNAIDFVRQSGQPGFFLVETYRLNAHSKGDDDRKPEEVQSYADRDFLNIFQKESPNYYDNYLESITAEIDSYIKDILSEDDLSLDEYYLKDKLIANRKWTPIEPINKRQVELINDFFHEQMNLNDKIIFIGEDILSPYGGAFKVAKGLSAKKPDRVFSTPISESAIMGISNGLALNGFRPFAEIMFGDFITLAFDQIVNHASKFYHIFNHQVKCPVVLRTPMGGRRGYGPTHSQTLDKFLIGIDNVITVAVNTLIDPGLVFNSVLKQEHPVIIIENKVDYGKKILAQKSSNFIYERNEDEFPIVRIRPTYSTPDITIVAYGGMADIVASALKDIFVETDLKPELIVFTQISPFNPELIIESVIVTGRLVIVEEGSAAGGIGSEVIASVMEQMNQPVQVKRIAALPVPIPSVKSLEHIVLPERNRIIEEINQHFVIR